MHNASRSTGCSTDGLVSQQTTDGRAIGEAKFEPNGACTNWHGSLADRSYSNLYVYHPSTASRNGACILDSCIQIFQNIFTSAHLVQ